MRANVCGFSKVTGAWIKALVQIIDIHANPVRHAVMVVAGVIVRVRRKRSCERIDPGARTQLALLPVQAAAIWIRAARAEVCACLAVRGVTGVADALFQCLKGMFHPRLSNLLKPIVVIGGAAHPVEVLGNDWMISL